MTRKNILLIGLASLVIFAAPGLIAGNYYSTCWYLDKYNYLSFCDNLNASLIPLIALIPFSAVLSFFRDEIFIAWWDFTRWWVPIITILIVLTPWGGGGFGPSLAIDGMVMSLFFSFLFVVISTILILVKYIQVRRKG